MRVIDEKDIAISKLDNDLAYANACASVQKTPLVMQTPCPDKPTVPASLITPQSTWNTNRHWQ